MPGLGAAGQRIPEIPAEEAADAVRMEGIERYVGFPPEAVGPELLTHEDASF